MATTNEPSDSATAREQGNAFYKKGQFPQAEKAYLQAADLDPEDPAPWSNISAIKFEQGKYKASLESLDKALALSSSEQDDSPKKQKLLVRKAKCQLHLLSLSEAGKTVHMLQDDGPGKDLSSSLKGLADLWAAVPDEITLRKQIFDRLTRYKAELLTTPSYFAMGHDTAESLLDDKLKASASSPDKTLAFLLAGSGDARNLFVTLIKLSQWDRGTNRSLTQKFSKAHFTLVDVNPTSLARMIVILDMVIRYAFLKLQKLPRIEDALTICAYVYSSAFVPPFVVEKMAEHIRALINDLEGDYEKHKSIVFFTLYLPEESRPKVVRVLKQWLQEDEEYTPKALRSKIQKARKDQAENVASMLGSRERLRPEYLEQDQKDMEALGVMFAPAPFIERREPELGKLLKDYRSGSGQGLKALEKHIDTHWKLNPTIVDKEFERQKKVDTKGEDLLPHIEWDPLELLKAFVSPATNATIGDCSLIEGVSVTFDLMASSTFTILDRIQVEAIAGEMTDVLERLRHGCLTHRQHKPRDRKSTDPTTFPSRYDRVHMSNIPDYIGGPFTSHLYGLPVLRTDKPSSSLCFNNLLNPPMFRTHDDFVSEYLLMHEGPLIASHFGLSREKAALDDAQQDRLNKMIDMGVPSFATEGYFTWVPTPLSSSRSSYLSRPALERWLHAHLLKLCVPHTRPYWNDRPVYAPLNLTAFFRLVARLHEVGYPAHWLSGVLASVCDGAVTTTARFPRNIVTTPQDVETIHSSRKISLGPWRGEYTTLLSLWRRILPFGVVTPEEALVPLSEIVECGVTFRDFPLNGGRIPHYAIIFFDVAKLGGDISQLQLPEMVQDDEKGDTSEKAGRIRDGGIHFVTSLKYDLQTRKATFWMRRDVVEEVTKRGEWMVGLCRMDVWQVIPQSCQGTEGVVRQLRGWA